MRFFFYGTLMDEAVRAAVLGPAAARLTLEPATLLGWRRLAMRGRHYPIIVPAPRCRVAGLLAEGIDRAGLVRLDRFEAAEYRRLRVNVRRAFGGPVAAWVYVARSGAAAGAPWNFADWRRGHRAALLRRLRPPIRGSGG